MILGIGTDIVQISRIENILEKYASRFIEKNFHPLEIKKLPTNQNHRFLASHLAKRFAAKEALAKAIGKGIGVVKSFAFQEIAVLNDEQGMPFFLLDGKSFDNYRDCQFSLSLADDYPVAVAFVVISRQNF